MLITILVILGVLIFGGMGYFIYCDISLQKMEKAEKKNQNSKK